MGYRTGYTLEVRHPDDESGLSDKHFVALIIDGLRTTCEEAEYSLSKDGSTEEHSKWYEHEKDLRIFSKTYPHFLFVLKGEGEEPGDIWKKYFLNGKCQEARAVLTISNFDRTQLK